MQHLEQKVLNWANEKGILKLENAKNQLLKFFEEAGEVSGAILKNVLPSANDLTCLFFTMLHGKCTCP